MPYCVRPQPLAYTGNIFDRHRDKALDCSHQLRLNCRVLRLPWMDICF